MMLFMAAIALAALQTSDATTPPAGAGPLVVAQGRGVQIYRCDGAGDTYQWIFVSPEAGLFDDSGLKVGTHGAGPAWTWNDGSTVRGTVLAKTPSSDPASVPWLLLRATPAPGTGKLAATTFVRRSETHGGNAPATGCDTAHVGTMLRVPYTATYTFYKKTQ